MAITVPVPIDPAPVVPNSSEDTVIFDVKQEDFYRFEKEKLQPGMNALAEAGYQNALSAQGSATAALASETAAAQSALQAGATAHYKGLWSSLPPGGLAPPANVTHQNRTWMLLYAVANVAVAEPGVSPAWAPNDTVFPVVPVDTASVAMLAGFEYQLSFNGKVEATMPAQIQGAAVVITVCNGRRDNILRRANALDSFMGKPPDDIVLNVPGRFALRALFNSWRGF